MVNDLESKISKAHSMYQDIQNLEMEKVDGLTIAQLFGKLNRLESLYDEHHRLFKEIADQTDKRKKGPHPKKEKI